MATVVYGRNLDSLMQNKIGMENAEANKQASYRQFLNQIANTGVASREADSMDRYRMGDIDVRKYGAETGRMDVNNMADYRKGDLGVRSAESQGMNAYRQGLVRNTGEATAANERIAGLQAQTAASNLDKQIEANKYLTQFRVFQPTELEQANVGLINAQTEQLRKGGFGALSGDQKTLAISDITGRRSAQSQLPILQGNVDAEVSRLLGGRGFIDSKEYDALQEEAKLMPGGATDDNIKKVARRKATSYVMGTAKGYGIDPTYLSLDAAGNLVVPDSPYASLLNQGANPVPGATPTPSPAPAPAPSADMSGMRYVVPVDPDQMSGQAAASPSLSVPSAAPSGATPNRVFNPRRPAAGGTAANLSGAVSAAGQSSTASTAPSPAPESVNPPEPYGPPAPPAQAYQSRLRDLFMIQSLNGAAGSGAPGALTAPFFAGAAEALNVPYQQVGASNRYKLPRSVVADNWDEYGKAFEALPEETKNKVFQDALNAASDIGPTGNSSGIGGYNDRNIPWLDWTRNPPAR